MVPNSTRQEIETTNICKYVMKYYQWLHFKVTKFNKMNNFGQIFFGSRFYHLYSAQTILRALQFPVELINKTEFFSVDIHSVSVYKKRSIRNASKNLSNLKKQRGENCVFLENLRNQFTKPHKWKFPIVSYKPILSVYKI